MKPCNLLSLSSLILVLPTSVALSTETQESRWRNSIEVYMLGLNIHGDTSIGRFSSEVDVDPKFIVDHLDIGAMLRFESIYQSKWGYYIDYSFMNLSGDVNNIKGALPNARYRADIEIRQGVLEAKAFQREQYSFGKLDYMFGLRWWDNDITGKLYRNDNRVLEDRLSLQEDWVDFLVGLRLIDELSENWRFHASIDAGLGNDTHFTYAIQTGVRYRFNEWSDLNLAYKSTWVDYKNEGVFEYDTASQGLLVGLGFYF
ncbi:MULTISPECIES: hypothetical protein [Vibrio]|uniref:hypothetical protein n=1 Tax=Vibrio TaxID=662 RepID=UPI0005ACAD33|nr:MULTISPECIES: hypothetical protein [Vibrio]EIK0771521.1 hypothetical protein [Vibrio alginolyticus]ELB2849588.1 hypothetical protein [Vibrio alginolyticus]KIP72516.1 hypothetical protein SN12_09390 [Vibrio alginolyticus]KIP81807.1 hypothetical protein SN13_16630 [Vibrio alginolyticus]MCA2488285.1 hypothetical protein [Vibrio alginolyticus]